MLEGLRAKAPKVVADLGREPVEPRLALFARSGFTRALDARARAEGVMLVGVEAVG